MLTAEIHVDPVNDSSTSTSSPKLMHRFDEKQVKMLLEDADSA